MAKFKTEAKRASEVKQQNNWYWTKYFVKQSKEGADLHEMFDTDSVVDAITIDDVKKAAAQYLDGKNCSKFILMPEKKMTN